MQQRANDKSSIACSANLDKCSPPDEPNPATATSKHSPASSVTLAQQLVTAHTRSAHAKLGVPARHQAGRKWKFWRLRAQRSSKCPSRWICTPMTGLPGQPSEGRPLAPPVTRPISRPQLRVRAKHYLGGYCACVMTYAVSGNLQMRNVVAAGEFQSPARLVACQSGYGVCEPKARHVMLPQASITPLISSHDGLDSNTSNI
jgi:hypothetical protein